MEWFRQLADSIPHIVLVRTPDGAVEYVNRRGLEYAGLAEHSAAAWEALVHPEDRARFAAAWEEVCHGAQEASAEFRMRRASDGAQRWQLGRVVAVHDSAGAVARLFGSITDIEDQKATERALRESQRLESVGLLAGGIAHDFNNLLTSILGYASLARAEAPPSLAGPLEAIIEASEKAAGLTRQLLAYAGKGQFCVEIFSLAELVRSTTELMRLSISKNVELRLELGPDLPPVRADFAQLQQVVMNLVINAAEAIGEARPGTVSIAVDEAASGGAGGLPAGRYVRLAVRDNGSGIEAAALPRIFDPFFSTKFTGRGLGLAAVQGILRTHKGAIAVETAPGRGSTFTVCLPAAAWPHPPRQAPPGRATILLVDDEHAIREIGRAALERLGYSVLLAEDGRQAVEALEAHPAVDLVLLDILMPVAGGGEALAEIRRRRPELPVLISSGYSREEVRRIASVPDEVPFIQKPFSIAKLAAAVWSALESPAALTSTRA